jgi:hypothetical protein
MTTSSPTSQRWDRVEQPILEALAAGYGSAVSGGQLQAATGIGNPVLMRAAEPARGPLPRLRGDRC